MVRSHTGSLTSSDELYGDLSISANQYKLALKILIEDGEIDGIIGIVVRAFTIWAYLSRRGY